MNEPAAPVSTREVYAFGDGLSLPARRREAAPLLSSEPAKDPLELPHPLIHPSPLTQVINTLSHLSSSSSSASSSRAFFLFHLGLFRELVEVTHFLVLGQVGHSEGASCRLLSSSLASFLSSFSHSSMMCWAV
jgi:hypothetical protein